MAAHKPKTNVKELLSWTKLDKRGKIVESYVPGVNMTGKGNLRPRIKGAKVKEVKATVPTVQPETEQEVRDDEEDFGVEQHVGLGLADPVSEVSQSLIDTDASTVTTTRSSHKVLNGGGGVSLRDLCVEDKKRVANLIKELAKLGEEKESAEKNLELERQRYEEQILKLCDQQEEILKEREEVQQRMIEYHTYIVKLKQQQKSQKKVKAKQDTDVQQSKESPPRHSSQRDVDPRFVTDEEPSKHIYLNDFDLDESNQNHSNSVGVDNFSTQVQPAFSPRQSVIMSQEHGKQGKTAESPRQDRPFTALINQELENQKRALAVAMNNSEFRSVVSDNKKEEFERFDDERFLVENNDLNMARLSLGLNGKKSFSPRPAPPRPPPPKLHDRLVSGSRQLGEGRDEHDIEMKGKENVRHCSREHNLDIDSDRPGTTEFPHGNMALLTPEKNEILSRFMLSQHEAGVRQISDQGCETNEIHNGSEGEFNGQVRSERASQNKLTEPARCKEFERTGERKHGGRLGENEEKKSSNIMHQHIHSQKQRSNKPNVHHKKHHRPPPSSYGPLQPPVMSSTQKSNEFADFVSVESMETSIPVGRHRNRDSLRYPKMSSSPREKGDNNKGHGKSVDFTEQPGEPIKERVVSEHDDFLEKYRRMSPSERKQELLKQKALLLEEQSKLKLVLAEQENQLQLKQEEAAVKIEQYQDMKDAGINEFEKGELQESLRRLEVELAKKEEELIKGRQLLQQKRQAQAKFLDQAKKATNDQMLPPVLEPKSSVGDVVLSSTPKTLTDKTPVLSDAEAEGKKLSGRDGDSCELYSSSVASAGTAHSKNKTDVDNKQEHAPSGAEAHVNGISTRDSTTDLTPEKRQVDAATSISYANLPSVSPETEQTELQSRKKASPRKERSHRKSPRQSLSPGEKTLSVIEIINSLNDDILSPKPNIPSNHVQLKTRNLDEAVQERHFAYNDNNSTQLKCGLFNLINRQAVNQKHNSVESLFQSGSMNKKGTSLKPTSVIKSGQIFSGSNAFSARSLPQGMKLGGRGSFGLGEYSASNVITGLSKPGNSLKPTESFAATFPGLSADVGAKQKFRNKCPPAEADDNLGLFELKRVKPVILNDGNCGSGENTNHNNNNMEEEEDVIDFILKTRHNLMVEGDDDILYDDDAADSLNNDDVDLSALCDNDGNDSNLDELVRVLEIQDDIAEESDNDSVDEIQRKLKSSARTGGMRKNKTHKERLETDDDDDDDNDDDDGGLLAMVLRSYDEKDNNNEDIVDDLDKDCDNVEDEDEWENLEESQILEDIFFVQ